MTKTSRAGITPLAELRQRAQAELDSNPTIAVYWFTPEGFIVSRPASAKAQLRANVDSINKAIARVAKQFTELRATFERIGCP
ncbi:hypothetical protein [Mycolicibacterium senegalense]|uniref:Uncharacterized protein n=1 Tax=Mycolicibacterium senegalense TaxID=1796 RepID=A0ABR5G1T0_9MYCO|nr:hypothetical protein [Mycolicibacterium senegalense]KLI05816.1 hypothetical protein AA982_22985 [Mycolicibacterium senegalense]KLO54100.1 hypothetical protein ABW05_24155 [Mycolicibacterium senegalense]KLO54165.1 hypothetical protein ABW05_24580 [Mycolicibacterium senegalense]